MKLEFKRLRPTACVPTYAHEGDAGFDLYVSEDTIIYPGESAMVPTALSVALPEGYELQVRNRSGITSRTKLRVQLGTVDAGYRGEIHIMVDNLEHFATGLTDEHVLTIDKYNNLQNIGDKYPVGTYLVRAGDRIAQGVINRVERVRFEEVAELPESVRGEGGFGSTDAYDFDLLADAYAQAQRKGPAIGGSVTDHIIRDYFEDED
jgi:dUTP pyrophosphatase